ncbi:SGNH/GDSL hydrolase family protein [Ralstonia sp. UBA689]|uniref:SGNH/GDSL hydrolase family protein n=1 Tax=Ralstonia sp. UBA689 TaxID=1947373 RepID=UPI0025F6A822|nr:SGNH/GDSL hydrolase family protein [Ralstonia sp. UBA689]
MKSIRRILLSLCCVISASFATSAHALGSPTYTYLRCFYRVDTSPLKPNATYAWGIDPASGGYYRIYGRWWKDGLTSWENMFYSDVGQNTLKSVCQSTLANAGINRPVAMVAAADSSASLNYTVWTNDTADQATSINKIVAFGDSLSDNQNLFNGTQWQVPNRNSWFLGHFSNDKVWVEYVAGNTLLPMYNWAVAGAAADTYMVIPGVSQQVDSWITYMQSAPNYRPENTLFTVLVGGNDIINYNRTVDSIISVEQQALQKLINAGAKNILLLNLPDVSRAPVFQFRSNGATVAAQVVDFNQKLVQLRDSLQATYGPSLVIGMFDTNTMFNDLFNNPTKYGVTNTWQSCLTIDKDSSTTYLYSWPTRVECTNPDTYLFWDTLHPTTHTHKLLGDAVTSFVRSNFPTMPAQ